MQTKNFNVYDEENLAVQDAYALIATNVHFKGENESIKAIAICSSMPGVGKTTIAINLAISMARSGWKTLLIDADIRKPGSYKRLNENSVLGLTDIIEDGFNLQDALSMTNIPDLSYLSCGKSSHNPIMVLSSAKFDEIIIKAKEQYDFILVDTPALSTVIDGAIAAAKTDAVVVVVEMGMTKLTSLKRAKEQLEKVNANVMGVVLNKVKKRDYVKYVASYNYFERFRKEENHNDKIQTSFRDKDV